MIFLNVRNATGCGGIKMVRMRNFSMKVLFLAGIVALMAATAPAQRKSAANPLRDVQGSVSDADGKPVSGAVVQLKNTKTLAIISFITKDQGDYYFHGLSPDIDFELSGEKAGKVSAVRTLSSFDSRKQAVINLKLDKDKKS